MKRIVQLSYWFLFFMMAPLWIVGAVSYVALAVMESLAFEIEQRYGA